MTVMSRTKSMASSFAFSAASDSARKSCLRSKAELCRARTRIVSHFAPRRISARHTATGAFKTEQLADECRGEEGGMDEATGYFIIINVK